MTFGTPVSRNRPARPMLSVQITKASTARALVMSHLGFQNGTADLPTVCGASPSSGLHMEPSALPPETLEGWYALHQLYTVDRRALRSLAPNTARDLRCTTADTLRAITHDEGEGWSAVVSLTGSTADVLFMHFRPTLDEVRDVQRRLDRLPVMDFLRPAMYF